MKALKSINSVESTNYDTLNQLSIVSEDTHNSQVSHESQFNLIVKQGAAFPQIPSVKFVVTKGDINEEFDSYRELYQWAADRRDINKMARDWYSGLTWDEQRKFTLLEYVSEYALVLLEENDYKVDRVPTWDTSNEKVRGI